MLSPKGAVLVFITAPHLFFILNSFLLEFPNKKLSSSIICSVCSMVHRYSPFISSTVSSRLNCSYVRGKSHHCLFLVSISLLSSAIIFFYSLFFRHSINLSFDSNFPISSSFLQKSLKIERFELFIVLHRQHELSGLEIKL